MVTFPDNLPHTAINYYEFDPHGSLYFWLKSMRVDLSKCPIIYGREQERVGDIDEDSKLVWGWSILLPDNKRIFMLDDCQTQDGAP